MDPLTHIVVGRAVVAAADRHEPARRGVAWAAVLGALSPDIDAALAFAGWDRYVRIHEVGTHSIVGAFAMACLTALVVRGVGILRPLPGRDTRPRLPAGFGALLAAAFAGAMSHLALDIVSGARIRAGWPIVSPVVTLPLVAMADPWLIAICVIGLVALWPGRLRLRTVSRVMIAAAAVLLVIKGALLSRALSASRFSGVPFTAVEAQWGSLTRWRVFERSPSQLRAWSISAREPANIVIVQALGPEPPVVDRSRSLDAVENFLAVHDFAFPVEKPADRGRTEVLWSDLRYCWGDELGQVDEADPADAAGAEGPGRHRIRSCGVWVGALFGTDARPLTQLVTVGAVTQSRPARP